MTARSEDPLLDLPDWMDRPIVRNKRFGKSDLVLQGVCCSHCWMETIPGNLSISRFGDISYYCSSKCLRASKTDYSPMHNINYEVHVRYISHTVHTLSIFYISKSAPLFANTYYPRVAPVLLPAS